MIYIIERPAGMPDWVEIGIKILGKSEYFDTWIEDTLTGYSFVPGDKIPYRGRKSDYSEAKPYIPWTPKEGEWCAFWCGWDKYFTLRPFSGTLGDKFLSPIVAKDGRIAWDYCARITNDDGTLIDIRCTVDELKAKTDWLGPEEN
jgi:hypothetical protein